MVGRILRYICYEVGWEREERTNSVKYFRKFLVSRSRNLVVNSMAVSGGQFCEGRKTEIKKSEASWTGARGEHVY